MIAYQQYTRLYDDIGNPTEDPHIPADTRLEPTPALANAHTDAAPVVHPPAADEAGRVKARLDAAQAIFTRLRLKCPYVGLHENGTDTTKAKKMQRYLRFGMMLTCLDVFSAFERKTPAGENY